MARAVAMPGALVIGAALGGAALGGILGALVAVPIAAAGITIVNRVIIPALQSCGGRGPYPRILDMGCDYAAGRSVAV